MQHTLAKKGKVLPYSLPSVGPGADPGVQTVSPQVTFKVIPGVRLLFCVSTIVQLRSDSMLINGYVMLCYVITFRQTCGHVHHCPSTGTKLQCTLLGDRGT